MAETNDITQHSRSINVFPTSTPGLSGVRYWNNFKYNQNYNVPQSKWQPIKQQLEQLTVDNQSNIQSIQDFCGWYVNNHNVFQVPRIIMLERYYQGDSDIHYWKSDKKKRADNRIAGGLPRYITNFGVGYEFGNDLVFGYENDDDENDTGDKLLQNIDDFNNGSDEPYHEKNMGKNLWNTGRAYELLYVPQGSTSPKMAFIDPNQCFVVYDTSIEKNPLFAIRYYLVDVQDQRNYQIELYTDDKIYYFTAGDDPCADWHLDDIQEHFFGDVPINEIDANNDRMGKFEPHLDKIDARDKALSEMANSEEDFNNATLVISGDIEDTQIEHVKTNENELVYVDSITGEHTLDQFTDDGNGNEIENKPLLKNHEHDLKSNMIILKPTKNFDSNGNPTYFPTQAQYLTKDLNTQGWLDYIDKLTADIHKETNTPDMSDASFAGNSSGVAMAYKLMGSDQERVMTETLYKRGISRRLRLLCNYWDKLPGSNINFNQADESTNPANNVTVKFTPNLPKNEAEIISNIVQLCNTGAISDETKLDLISQVDGIPTAQEQQRLSDEQDAKDARAQQFTNNLMQQRNNSDDSSSNDDGEQPDNTGVDNNSTSDDGNNDNE